MCSAKGSLSFVRRWEVLCAQSLDSQPWCENAHSSGAPIRPLTRDVSISALKQCAQLLNDRFGIGLDPDAIGNGSFRRGGASWLHELGVSDALIKVLGRWRSNTYQIYIERPLSATVSAQRLLSVSAGDALGSARRWLGGTRARSQDFDPWAAEE